MDSDILKWQLETILRFRHFIRRFYMENPAPQAPPIAGIPKKLLDEIRHRSNRHETSRFPYKVRALLNWVENDPEKANIAGCGWVQDSNNEFFINKSRLREVMDVKLNTLNVNLKTLGFELTRRSGELSFYKNQAFSKNSSNQDLGRIRNSRCKPDSLMNMNTQAAYLPLLEHIKLYRMDEKSINLFKRDVVQKWEFLVGSTLIFAVSFPSFTKLLFSKLEETREFYDDYSTIQQVLMVKTPNVVTIFDFAVFLARFGPFNNFPYKIMAYQQIVSDMRPDYFMFTAPSLTSYFSTTFDNCFSFKLTPNGEYHCYNLPLIFSNADSGYLVDEDGEYYKTWSIMLRSNYFLTQRG